MRVAIHLPSLAGIPVDFFADPDGPWEYEDLVRSAGLDPEAAQAASCELFIGALTETYLGFPEGAAVLWFSSPRGCAVRLVDCGAAASTSVAA
jgi:hypothetical protein